MGEGSSSTMNADFQVSFGGFRGVGDGGGDELDVTLFDDSRTTEGLRPACHKLSPGIIHGDACERLCGSR